MKKLSTILFSVSFILSLAFIAGCSKDDSMNPDSGSAQGTITGLTASLSTSNGRTIYLSWNGVPDKSSLKNYHVYRADGTTSEFTDYGSAKDTSYTDNVTRTLNNTTYQYYVTYDDTYTSDTITIQTADASLPFVSGYVNVTGEGSAASILYTHLDWYVGSEDQVDHYEVYRDGNLLGTVIAGYKEYKDETSQNFDQEYLYKVVTVTKSGDRFESPECALTPHRPDAVFRTVPEIIKVTSNSSDKSIDVIISDVSNDPADLIGFSGEIEGTGYSWNFETKVEDCGKDADGNLIIGLDASGANLPSGQTIWLRSKVRIFTQGGYSDWSAYFESTIF